MTRWDLVSVPIVACVGCGGVAMDRAARDGGTGLMSEAGALAPAPFDGAVFGPQEGGGNGAGAGGTAPIGSTVGGSNAGAGGAICAAIPRQLIDFNSLARELGATAIGAMHLAADATSIYFVFGGSLLRIPIGGGSAVTLLKLTLNVTQNNDPVATSTAVIFHQITGTGSDEEIVSMPKAGGQPHTLAISHGRVLAFQSSDSDVYFVDQSGVQSVPSGGGSVRVLTDTIATDTTGLTVVGSNLLVTTSTPVGSAGALYSVPIGGGTPTTLAAQQPNAKFPMACGSDLCWWTGAPASAMGPTGPGFIARLAGNRVTTISAPVFPITLSFDGTDFFETVGCDLCPGSLVRIPASGNPAVTMVTAAYAVVEGPCVYFSVASGFDLPSSYDGGVPGSGIYAVSKSYADPAWQRDM